ncbi:MAG: hypothetical protein JW395_1290 [Nitrospira sp.]|nr:hypothetical protein [Nitrospira sp.]
MGELRFKCSSRIYFQSMRSNLLTCSTFRHTSLTRGYIPLSFWSSRALYILPFKYPIRQLLPPFRPLPKRHLHILQRISRRTSVLVEVVANSLIGPNSCWIFSNFFCGHYVF